MYSLIQVDTIQNLSEIYQHLVFIGYLVVIGVSVVYHNQTEETVIDQKVLGAYHDVVTELEEVAMEYVEFILTIKVYDQDNGLID